MKIALAAVALLIALLVVRASPFSLERPVRSNYYQSPVDILPMTFAHADHAAENCLLCHHNYNDATGGDPCMYCHVNNIEIASMLEQQFHALCRDCHEQRQLEGKIGGPTRRCLDCHLGDDAP